MCLYCVNKYFKTIFVLNFFWNFTKIFVVLTAFLQHLHIKYISAYKNKLI